MQTINDLSPKPVWSIFKQICDIPHPSLHEIKLRDFIQAQCQAKGLETFTDETGNLFVKKPATPGMENRVTVVMQGHIDMVPQKNADSSHDFVTDPIDTYIDGDWLKAKGTTLGADNGMGVAAALAVMLSDDIVHGPLEMLCTIEEETSMRGAFGLQPGCLDAKILLNLDTEDEGELYVGCAGGVDINASIPLETEQTPEGHSAFEIAITGLKGGHSGLDINSGRGNANKLVNAFLMMEGKRLELKVASFNGGTLRNAIPRESFTQVLVPNQNLDAFNQAINRFEQQTQVELGAVEPKLQVRIREIQTPAKILTSDLQKRVINSVAACISAPLRMSDAFTGVVETSNNLAIVKNSEQAIEIKCLTRSLSNHARDVAARSVAATFELAGAQTSLTGAYPGWKPNINSPILKNMSEGYEKLYGKVPAVKVIHAGLECGLLGEAYPDMDMISFGPTIRGAHSPDERCHIPSVEKFWNYLLDSLKHIPERA